MTYSILLVTDPSKSVNLNLFQRALSPLGKVQFASEDEGFSYVGKNQYDLCLLDEASVTRVIDLIPQLLGKEPGLRIVILTNSPTWKHARDAFSNGAVDYLLMTLDEKLLRSKLRAVIAHQSKLNQTVPKVDRAIAEELLNALTIVKAHLDQRVMREIRFTVSVYIAALVVLWLSIILLIIKFGWNAIDPWTYIAGLGLTLGSYAYFMIKQKEITPKSIYNQIVITKTNKVYISYGFDAQKYQRLQLQISSRSASSRRLP